MDFSLSLYPHKRGLPSPFHDENLIFVIKTNNKSKQKHKIIIQS